MRAVGRTDVRRTESSIEYGTNAVTKPLNMDSSSSTRSRASATPGSSPCATQNRSVMKNPFGVFHHKKNSSGWATVGIGLRFCASYEPHSPDGLVLVHTDPIRAG